jgi:hypothetical protein
MYVRRYHFLQPGGDEIELFLVAILQIDSEEGSEMWVTNEHSSCGLGTIHS